MKLKGNYKFQATREQVWALFTDPKNLQEAIPGCKKLEETEPGKFDALLEIGIAAVKGTYDGKFELVNPEPPNRYVLAGEGGGSAGFVKGEGLIELTSNENGSTLVSYKGDVQIGGLIAGVGQRMISGISKMMADQFFKSMVKQLLIQKGAYQPGLFEKMWTWI